MISDITHAVSQTAWFPTKDTAKNATLIIFLDLMVFVLTRMNFVIATMAMDIVLNVLLNII